jgi:hypothetical protein
MSTGPLESDARIRVYRLRPQPFEALQRWLPAFWDGQLEAFKAHAERTRP